MKVNKKIKYSVGFATASCFMFAAFQNFTVDSSLPGTKACSQAKINEILTPATADKLAVTVNCSTKLPAGSVISKQVLFTGKASSGATFDCNGGSIVLNSFKPNADALIIRSRTINVSATEKQWERTEKVTINNCTIGSGVRVYGMAASGEGSYLRESSRQDANHTQRAQANAPKDILLNKLKIKTAGRIGLYVSPGVTYLTLQNSSISGNANLAIYFDAESANNSLLNNSINLTTETREVMAIDGSANNLVQGNKFSALSNGGIYLYRNCGEGGTIRHQTPSGNKIVDNIFYYNGYKGSNPSIYLGARNGNRNYCGLDNGFPWGSSVSDGDFARNNTVTGNKIYKRALKEMILSSDSSNNISNNYVVTAETVNNPVAAVPVVTKPVTNEVLWCSHIPKSGNCGYDVGKYKDRQRGTVRGYFKRDDKCNFQVKAIATKASVDTGFVAGRSLQIVGDRGFKYNVSVDANELLVKSSGGQDVCVLKF